MLKTPVIESISEEEEEKFEFRSSNKEESISSRSDTIPINFKINHDKDTELKKGNTNEITSLVQVIPVNQGENDLGKKER